MPKVINLCTSAEAVAEGVSSPPAAAKENNHDRSFNDSALHPAQDEEECQEAFVLLPQLVAPEEEEEEEEEGEMDDRSEGELEGIAWEMQQLEKKFVGLKGTYKLVDRLGEGKLSHCLYILLLYADGVVIRHFLFRVQSSGSPSSPVRQLEMVRA